MGPIRLLIYVNAPGVAAGHRYVRSENTEGNRMRRFVMLAMVGAIVGVGTAAPTSAVAGCYRLGETGYHWYRYCLGPHWVYPHHRVCRHGRCWYR